MVVYYTCMSHCLYLEIFPRALTLPPLGGSVFIGVLLGDFDSTLYYGVQFLCSTWYIVLSTTVHV